MASVGGFGNFSSIKLAAWFVFLLLLPVLGKRWDGATHDNGVSRVLTPTLAPEVSGEEIFGLKAWSFSAYSQIATGVSSSYFYSIYTGAVDAP